MGCGGFLKKKYLGSRSSGLSSNIWQGKILWIGSVTYCVTPSSWPPSGGMLYLPLFVLASLRRQLFCRFLIGTVAYFPLLTLLFPTPNGLESPINIGLFYVFLCPDPIMNIERENFSMRQSHEIYVLIICLSHIHETYMSLRHRSHETVS